MEILTPRPLRGGDLISIVSPASVIDAAIVEGAAARLTDLGYRVDVAPHALGRHGTYAASDADRISDLTGALTNPDVRAILCSRGGYGCVHLLEALSQLDLRKDPKWLIGFSDVSALHALMTSQGLMSVHGSMAKALAQHDADFGPNKALLELITTGKMPEITAESHRYNRPGRATGRLLGGNLAVIQALISTPYNVIMPDTLLYIEDIAEPIYKVERILYQLKLNGTLANLRGLIVGQFTEYKPDNNYGAMEDMINDILAGVEMPVAFDMPIGHMDENRPVLNNSMATLSVDERGARLEG